jgi:hypothetical protein
LIQLGICSECSLYTLSGTTPGCSLCTLSRTTLGCSLYTLSGTTGSLKGGSFVSPLWIRVGWGLSVGIVSLWELSLQGEVGRSWGLLHLVICPSRLTRNPQVWHTYLPLCHLRQAFLGFNRCVQIISSKSRWCSFPQ